MAFLDKSKANYAFKALNGKAHTSNGRELSNESIVSGITLSAGRIFADSINTNPADSSNTGIVSAQITLILEAIAGSDTFTLGEYQGYRAKLSGTVPASLVGITNPVTGAPYAANDYVGNIIPQSFGDNYRPILYSDAAATIEIPPSSAADWFIDCYAGVVVQEGSEDGGTPFILGSNGRLKAYIYTGRSVKDALTSGGSGGSGSSEWLDSAKGFSQDLIGGTNAFFNFYNDTALTNHIDQSLLINGLRWVHIGSTVSGLNIYNPTTNTFSTGSISNNDVVEYYVSMGTSGTIGYIKTTPTNGTFISFDSDLSEIFRFTGTTWIAQDFGSTASNGLHKVGNDIQLGGTLTSSINIDDTSSNLNSFKIGLGTPINAYAVYSSTLDLSAQNAQIKINGTSGLSLLNSSAINIVTSTPNFGTITIDTPGTMHLNAGIMSVKGFDNTFAGAQYFADYSANFTPRSLVDAAYVAVQIGNAGTAGIISANNGLSLSGQTVQLGGTLSQNTSIDGATNTYSLAFNNLSGFTADAGGVGTITLASAHLNADALQFKADVNSSAQRLELTSSGLLADVSAGVITLASANLNADATQFIAYANAGANKIQLNSSVFVADVGAGNITLTSANLQADVFKFRADLTTGELLHLDAGALTIDVGSGTFDFNSSNVIVSNTEVKFSVAMSYIDMTGTTMTLSNNASQQIAIDDITGILIKTNSAGQDINLFAQTGVLNLGSSIDSHIQIDNGTTNNITVTLDSGKQFAYAADYSASYTSRSLVDKTYVDSIAAGLNPKEAVRVATTTYITLSGLQTIDGVTLNDGDRVLVKDQGTAGQANGIYNAHSGAWTRSTDFDGSPTIEVSSGDFTFVSEGTTYQSTGWVVSTPNPIVLDTTIITWVQFSAAGVINANNGLTQTGENIQLGGTLLQNTTVALGLGNSLTLGLDSLNSGIEIQPNNLNIYSANTLNVTASTFTLINSPSSSTAGYDIIVRNTTNGNIEKITSSVLVGSVPTLADKNLTPSAGTNGNGNPTGLSITYAPTANGYVEVTVNGIAIVLGTSSSNGEGYFAQAGSGGTIGRALNAIVAGDEFFWNSTIAGYELDSSDNVSFLYSV